MLLIFAIGGVVYFVVGVELTRTILGVVDRSEPSVVLRFDRIRPNESPDQFRAEVLDRRSEVLTRRGCTFEWFGSVDYVPYGIVDDNWTFISVHAAEFSGDYVDATTSPEATRLKTDAATRVEESVTLRGAGKWPKIDQRRTTVFVLATVVESEHSAFQTNLRSLASAPSANLLYDNDVIKLSREPSRLADLLMIMQFADESAMVDWLQSARLQSLLALYSKHIEHFAVLVSTPLPLN